MYALGRTKKIKPGDIIYAEFVLSADAMREESITELPLSEEHDLRVLKSAFITGDFDRLWGILTDGCMYCSMNSHLYELGKEEVIHHLNKMKERIKDIPEYKYFARLATITDAPAGKEHQIGNHCIVLSQGEEDNYIAVVLATLNEENKVDELFLFDSMDYCFTDEI